MGLQRLTAFQIQTLCIEIEHRILRLLARNRKRGRKEVLAFFVVTFLMETTTHQIHDEKDVVTLVGSSLIHAPSIPPDLHA